MAKSYYKDIHNTREMHFSAQMNLFLQLFFFLFIKYRFHSIITSIYGTGICVCVSLQICNYFELFQKLMQIQDTGKYTDMEMSENSVSWTNL